LIRWRAMVKNIKSSNKPLRIGIVGNILGPVTLSFRSLYLCYWSCEHACFAAHRNPDIHWLNSEEYEKNPKKVQELKKFSGIIVPGGFGERGIEGKIKAIEFCRKNKVPYFGLCYGMQLAVIEFARHVLGLKDAHTTEINRETKTRSSTSYPSKRKSGWQKLWRNNAARRLSGHSQKRNDRLSSL